MTAHILQDPPELAKYYTFLRDKKRNAKTKGLAKVPALHPRLFPFQAAVTDFLLRAGCGAAFLDTGLGKAFIGLEWARVIRERTGKSVLILAPLAVGPQHEREAIRFGLEAKYIRDPSAITGPGVWITNYERLHLYRPQDFGGLVLDESSLLKAFTGKTSRALIAFGEQVPYRLALTATPAPNDHMELGQHSAFLGAMPSNEMLARWFIADQSEMGRYRLKKYGVDDFWSWIASWSRMASHPSDLGFSDDGFILPKLNYDLHYVSVNITEGRQSGELFRLVDTSSTKIHAEKRRTIASRAERIAELVDNEPNENWVIWCDTDYEANELNKRIPQGVEVRGSMSLDMKEDRLNAFVSGNERILITKPSIAGFGLNLQHCARCAFVGISYSYEAFYQAVRRFWRFGQQRPVNVHVAMAETEGVIWNTIQRKARDHETMKTAMTAAMRRAVRNHETKLAYQPTQSTKLPVWLKGVSK